MRAPGRTTVAGSFPGRTPAGAHRPRADGRSPGADPGRTVRRPRPGRPRTFPPVPQSPGSKESRPHSRAGDASRGGDHAGVQPRSFVEGGQRPGGRRQAQRASFTIAFRRVRISGFAAGKKRPLLAHRGAQDQTDDVIAHFFSSFLSSFFSSLSSFFTSSFS